MRPIGPSRLQVRFQGRDLLLELVAFQLRVDRGPARCRPAPSRPVPGAGATNRPCRRNHPAATSLATASLRACPAPPCRMSLASIAYEQPRQGLSGHAHANSRRLGRSGLPDRPGARLRVPRRTPHLLEVAQGECPGLEIRGLGPRRSPPANAGSWHSCSFILLN